MTCPLTLSPGPLPSSLPLFAKKSAEGKVGARIDCPRFARGFRDCSEKNCLPRTFHQLLSLLFFSVIVSQARGLDCCWCKRSKFPREVYSVSRASWFLSKGRQFMRRGFKVLVTESSSRTGPYTFSSCGSWVLNREEEGRVFLQRLRKSPCVSITQLGTRSRFVRPSTVGLFH